MKLKPLEGGSASSFGSVGSGAEFMKLKPLLAASDFSGSGCCAGSGATGAFRKLNPLGYGSSTFSTIGGA